jgi:hypothetical protein
MMTICERCYGYGVLPSFRYAIVRVVGERRRIVNLPYLCPYCNGSGVAHCCEGNEPEYGE